MTGTRKKGTKTERLARSRLLRSLWTLDEHPLFDDQIRRTIPVAWATLEEDVDVSEKKTKITLRIDSSVAKFYRAMGNGYQARMNRVLATYAQLQISQFVEFEDYMRRERKKLGMKPLNWDEYHGVSDV